jgi:hypothetical protein
VGSPNTRMDRRVRNINGINFDNYIKTFDPRHLHSVQQFLEMFACCPELEAALKNFLDDSFAVKQQRTRIYRAAEQQRDQERYFSETEIEPRPLPPIPKKCPDCDAQLGGVEMPSCEQRHSGRIAIEECSECSYYKEYFKQPDGPTGNRPWPRKKGGKHHGHRVRKISAKVI